MACVGLHGRGWARGQLSDAVCNAHVLDNGRVKNDQHVQNDQHPQDHCGCHTSWPSIKPESTTSWPSNSRPSARGTLMVY
jgi:hypothetical protein